MNRTSLDGIEKSRLAGQPALAWWLTRSISLFLAATGIHGSPRPELGGWRTPVPTDGRAAAAGFALWLADGGGAPSALALAAVPSSSALGLPLRACPTARRGRGTCLFPPTQTGFLRSKVTRRAHMGWGETSGTPEHAAAQVPSLQRISSYKGQTQTKWREKSEKTKTKTEES